MSDAGEGRPLALIERTLHDIWCEVLRLPQVRLTDSLDDLGGGAADRAEIWRRVRDHFGYEISQQALLAEPTIAAMAMALRGDAAPGRAGALVRLRAGRPGLPALYCFHPLGGSLAVYARLMSAVDRRWPVYGLQAVGLVEGRAPDWSIDAMARRYAAEIADAGHTGPAVFLGYSMGGLLALETARLAGPGSRPVDVVLVDTDTGPQSAPSPLSAYQTLVEIALGVDLDLQQLLGLPREGALTVIRDAAVAQRRLPASFSVDRLRRIADVCQANETAAACYVPGGPFPGRVHAINAGAAQTAVDAAEVRQHTVPGDHVALLAEPALHDVAAAVAEALSALEPAGSPQR